MQDSIAERAFYDELFGRDPTNEHILSGYEELYELAFRQPPSGTVLDLGCGTGAHAVRLAGRGCRVLAVDLTLAGVRAARRRFEDEGKAGLFLVADAERLPFRDEAVSVTWTSLLLHHFPKLDRLPAELARVTRDRVVAFEPNGHNLLTWLAFNVVNRVWGLSAMTRNQRALWPGRLSRTFGRYGFVRDALHYVDRGWSDGLTPIRRLYAALTGWLPTKVRANKFLIGFARERR